MIKEKYMVENYREDKKTNEAIWIIKPITSHNHL
jgi:hypothetical protein